MQFGMYSNGCGVSDWTYTGVKHYEKVLFFSIKENKKGTFLASQKIFGNYQEMIPTILKGLL